MATKEIFSAFFNISGLYYEKLGFLHMNLSDNRISRYWAFIILCAVGGFAIFSSTLSKNPVLPILASQIGADKPTIGLIAAASTVTGILTSLPAGLLSDRRGRKPVLIGSGLVFFTAPILYFLIQTPWQLGLVRVYHGLATAVFGPVAMAYVADLAPSRRGERLGYYSSTTLAGRALAPIVGGAILTGATWPWIYLVCAIAGLITLAGIFFLPSPRAFIALPDPSSSPRPPLSVTMADRNILITSIAEAAQYLAFGALEAFLPLYALSVGVNLVQVGFLFGAQIGVRTLARPILGIFSDRHGRKLPIFSGLIFTAVTMACFPLTSSFWVLLFLSVLFGLGLSTASAATSAFVADMAPTASRGAALGWMSTIMDVGQASGPVLLGAVLVAGTYLAGFALIGSIVLVSSILFWLLAREAKMIETRHD